jgi:chromosome segregation ATPase
MTLLRQFPNTPPQLFVYGGKMEAMRDTWTDDRMDDLVKRLDAGFAQTHEDIAELRADNKELRQEMGALESRHQTEMGRLASRQELHAEIHSLRSEMLQRFDKVDARFDKIDARFDKIDARFDKIDARFDTLGQRFDSLQRTLIAAVLAGFIGLLATHLA